MLTSSSGVFEQFKNQIGAVTTMVVELTDGVTTWYFSTMDMHLAEGHVHALVTGSISISESVNVFSKKWNVGGVTFKLKNEPYRKDSSGADVRVAGDLANIRGSEAKIYLVAGANITSLSDAITRFVGTVITAPSYDGKTLTIRLVDKGKLSNIKLPNSPLVGDIYTAAPLETKDMKIPIVYGEFSSDSPYPFNLGGGSARTDFVAGLGLALCLRTEFWPNDSKIKTVVSDHILNALDAVWAKIPELPVASWFEDQTLNVDNSGRGTANPDSNEAWTRLIPFDAFNGDYTTKQPADNVLNHQNAYDGNPDTFASVLDYTDTGSGAGGQMEGRFMFTFDDYAPGVRFETSIGDILRYLEIQIIAEEVDAGQSFDNKEVRMYYGQTVGVDDFDGFANLDATALANKTLQRLNMSGATPPDLVNNWRWQMRSQVVPPSNGDRFPMAGFIYLKTTANSGSDPDGDGIALNQTILKIYDVRFSIRHRLKAPGEIWASCFGREYGSWITSRSSSYSSGDAIEDPAGIIESILRDELGVATADIDLTTFIDAENTSMKARMNLHSDNEKTSTEAIREICEQSTFAFVWGANGTAKLIPLNDSSPTTNRIIPFSHVKEGSLKVSKTKETEIVNHITVKSRWQQEIEEYRDNDVVENATSQSAFGTFKMESTWANIAGTSVDHMTSHLVNDADAILANDHVIITFDAEGFTNADLEIGDWIELDDATFDTHQLCYGESWSGKQFLITATKAQMKTTTITAVELY